MSDNLIKRLTSAVAHMAPHQAERQNGKLLIEALAEIKNLSEKLNETMGHLEHETGLATARLKEIQYLREHGN